MKYFVKNQDGELAFGSIHELRAMFQQGLVDPEDQVRPEDSTTWRKAAAIPELREFAASKKADSSNARFLIVTVVCLSAACGVMMQHGLQFYTRLLIAGALMVPVLGMSQRAFTRAMRRNRE